MPFVVKLKSYSLFFLAISFVFSNVAYAADIRVALRAHKGAAKGLQQWQATADYLSEKIPEHRFILVPFENIGVMDQAVSRGDFQFSLANPSSAVEYNIRYGAQPIATLVNKRQGKGYPMFGAVIFTRADRNDINNLKDLKDKTIISVDELAFGGWRVAWKELLDNKINPYNYFKVLRFAGGRQQDVVYDVRDGKDDAGVVRTDMLERMAADGKINLNDFKILGEKKTKGFPFFHSSKLYPEWAFMTASKVDEKLVTQVKEALFSITVDHSAAMNGLYVKWISPLDYSPVEELLKELKVGPYNIATMGAYKRLVSQYGTTVIVIILVIFILLFVVIYMFRLNKQILSTKKSLKEEIKISSKLEQQLWHSQRIESLGQLTGGIAHDFNNMLGSIIGFTELSIETDTVKHDERLMGYLTQVMTAGDKCSALVNQMLAFSRTAGEQDNKEHMSVAVLIDEVHQLLRPILPSSLNLIINNVDENLFIEATPVMMNQIVMNLCLNAKDAINAEHGEISIGADILDIDASENILCDSCYKEVVGSYISIYVKDNGAGINLETKAHLFDPFFSTKEVGKGTGMGLSIVHGITHKHDGHILIESEVNKGTTISILLPQIKESGNKTKKNIEKNTITSVENTDKHILIIDDEISLTVYLSELLQQYGFKVTAFNDSEKALSYFRKSHHKIDLVLTDQTMPKLTGIEMSEKMLELSSNMPIILCTGYSDSVNNAIGNMNVSVYMDKPIQSDKLINMINSLIK